jgi:hypothetical protein
MSSAATPPSLWGTIKTVSLTGHTRHRHTPNPVSPGFKAPNASLNLSFGPTALAAAIARTATLRNAPIELLRRWRNSALEELELMVADGATFSLSAHFDYLSDTERTFFAARVGAGITDIMMNALGYTWRDNAACISSTLDPHADFVYAGGNASGYGVVLAEAHGSFANNVSRAVISRRAKHKYLRQVKPYLSTNSPHGPVIHGYSVAFGSKSGTLDTFLSLSETHVRKPRLRPPHSAPSNMATATQTSLVLASHRSNLILMDALTVVGWIDWVRGVADYPDSHRPVEFLRIPYDGRWFLACVDSLSPLARLPIWIQEFWRDPRWWTYLAPALLSRRNDFGQFAGWFVMEEQACERFLNALSNIIRSGARDVPRQFELPSLDPVGFGIAEGTVAPRNEDNPNYTYALFRDGLALLGTPPQRAADQRAWLPKEGLN